MTFAVLTLGLQRPRPATARLVSRPGMAACCAGAVALAAGLCGDLLLGVRREWTGPERPWGIWDFTRQIWYIFGVPVGPAVATAWLALAIGGRWRPRSDWIDRLGRFVGWSWIAFALLFQWQFGRWVSGLVTHIRR